MKKLLPIVLLAVSATTASAQSLVSTAPENKKAIIEEFTGVRCPNCPDGHAIAKSILDAHPREAFAVRLHPTNSSYTTPHNSTDPDFRRPYLDAFYASSYVGSRYMPGAMINRRTWGSERMTSRGSWMSHCQTIMGEQSPVNIGLASAYDEVADELTVDVELYFTSGVSDNLSVFIYLMEDGLVSQQSNGGSSYMHEHVFREALCGQWGDDITDPTDNGDYVMMQRSLDMATATDPVAMANAEVMALVYNKTTGEVITGTVVKAEGGSTVGIREHDFRSEVNIYPNPVQEVLWVEIATDEPMKAVVTVTDISGKEVYRSSSQLNAGTQVLDVDMANLRLSEGVYFISIEAGGQAITRKFFKQ